MKSSLLLIPIFFLCLIVTFQPIGRALTTDDLVLYLPLDEGAGASVQDESFYNNDGTITNAVWGNGIFNGGLVFDGDGDYITVPHSSSLTFTEEDFTVAFWMKVSGWAIDSIVTKGAYNVDGWYIMFYSAAVHKLDFYGISSGVTKYARSNAIANLDEWVHVAVVKHGQFATFYFNGTVAGESSQLMPNIAGNTRNLYIGEYSVGGGYGFNGTLDEIRIYNKALSYLEVEKLFEWNDSTLELSETMEIVYMIGLLGMIGVSLVLFRLKLGVVGIVWGIFGIAVAGSLVGNTAVPFYPYLTLGVGLIGMLLVMYSSYDMRGA